MTWRYSFHSPKLEVNSQCTEILPCKAVKWDLWDRYLIPWSPYQGPNICYMPKWPKNTSYKSNYKQSIEGALDCHDFDQKMLCPRTKIFNSWKVKLVKMAITVAIPNHWVAPAHLKQGSRQSRTLSPFCTSFRLLWKFKPHLRWPAFSFWLKYLQSMAIQSRTVFCIDVWLPNLYHHEKTITSIRDLIPWSLWSSDLSHPRLLQLTGNVWKIRVQYKSNLIKSTAVSLQSPPAHVIGEGLMSFEFHAQFWTEPSTLYAIVELGPFRSI